MPEVVAEADAAARLGAWLLEMGFPRATSREHLLTICRGNYRGVWESLMKQIHPRTQVRNRRLQVFAADIGRCRNFEDNLHEKMSAVVSCEELEIWRETEALRKQVLQAESRVALSKRSLRTLSGLVTDKAAQRAQLNNDVNETRRKSGAITLASEQLQMRAERLAEMIHITDQLAPSISLKNSSSINETVENCISVLCKMSLKRAAEGNRGGNASRSNKQFNSTALSDLSAISDEGCSERDSSVGIQYRLLDLIDRVIVTDLWEALHIKQDKLNAAMKDFSEQSPISLIDDGNCWSVIAETSALHCKLTLRTMDMKRRATALKKKLLELLTTAAVVESEEEAVRELLVLRCEEAGLQGRVTVLRDELHTLRQREGTYELQMLNADNGRAEAVLAAIVAINRELLAKKVDTEASLTSAEHTGAKIASVVMQLETLLPLRRGLAVGNAALEHEVSVQANYDDFVRHIRPSMLDTSAAHRLTKLKEFFTTILPERPIPLDLSLDLDHSADKDIINTLGMPRIVDELQFFLDKFLLHCNRKLVLPGGESLWISETLEQSQRHALYSVTYEVALAAIRMHILHRLTDQHNIGTRTREALGWMTPLHINYVDIIEHATKETEHMKKKARDTATALQQISSLIDVGLDNLVWWENCRAHAYVSEQRVVCGNTYRDYHSLHKNLYNNLHDSPF